MDDDDHIKEAACRVARVSGMSVEQAEAVIRQVLNAYRCELHAQLDRSAHLRSMIAPETPTDWPKPKITGI